MTEQPIYRFITRLTPGRFMLHVLPDPDDLTGGVAFLFRSEVQALCPNLASMEVGTTHEFLHNRPKDES